LFVVSSSPFDVVVESLVEQGFSVSGNTLEAAKVPTPAPQRRQ
jgi:hypothetical protein